MSGNRERRRVQDEKEHERNTGEIETEEQLLQQQPRENDDPSSTATNNLPGTSMNDDDDDENDAKFDDEQPSQLFSGQNGSTSAPRINDNNNNNATPNSPRSNDAFSVDLQSTLYAFESFRTISKPVSIAMFLAALASKWVTTEEWSENMRNSLGNTYNVVDADDEAGNSAKFGSSLVNGLVIVGFICVITFLVVALLKFRCLKILYGYLFLTFVSLLFFVASEFFRVSIDAFGLDRIDKVSYWLSLFNFAAVGTWSIFLPQGLPIWLTQSYLVLASVLVAWQLSQFDPWTAWVLLILLSLYDLFAVLTPCGPLKALINLMQKEDAPSMPPGLLFEARNRSANSNTNRAPSTEMTSTNFRQSQTTTTTRNASSASLGATDTSADTDRESTRGSSAPLTVDRQRPLESKTNAATMHDRNHFDAEKDHGSEKGSNVATAATESDSDSRHAPNENIESNNQRAFLYHENKSSESQKMVLRVPETPTKDSASNRHPSSVAPFTQRSSDHTTRKPERNNVSRTMDARFVDGRVVVIPMALARLYRLPLESDPNPVWRRPRRRQDDEEPSCGNEFSVEELQSLVSAIFPRNGGMIEPHPRQRPGKETRYMVNDYSGNLRRIVFVGASDGAVYEDKRHEERCDAYETGSEETPDNDRIRLGLGDFVFYSVLVALATDFSFSCFAACFVVILNGLMVTLLILAILKHALPALPVSILAAIVAYVLTRVLIQDWIEDIHLQRTYV